MKIVKEGGGGSVQKKKSSGKQGKILYGAEHQMKQMETSDMAAKHQSGTSADVRVNKDTGDIRQQKLMTEV